MKSSDYWRDREEEALKHYISDERAYYKLIDEIYEEMLDGAQQEIDSFYAKYAKAEGITIAEAKKRVSKLDIKAYERKAKRYVEDAARDRAANNDQTDYSGYYFSDKANAEMRLYNATMKINRLEMLKANIGLHLIKGTAKLESFMGKILKGRTAAELERQAGILGKTVRNNARNANALVNASFKSATFSDRLWQHHDLMKADLAKLLQTGLIQGKNPRVLATELRKYFIGEKTLKNGKKGAKYYTERLMRTELARVQTEAQKQSFERNGFTMYEFIVNRGCCPICEKVAKENGGHYKVEDMQPGLNAPPMHPNCRCSTAAWEDDDEYEAWLDYLSSGGTTADWNKSARAKWAKGKNG